MRWADIPDYFTLLRFLKKPGAFLHLRKHPMEGTHVDLELHRGGSVRLRNVPMDRHTFHRIFARDEYRLKGLREGSLGTVIDVGAHIGLFALRVSPLATRVLSFEPVPANFATLVHNVSSLPNVSAVPKAVTGRRETATIYVSDNPSAHSLYPSATELKTNPTRVECVTLEDVFSEYGVDRCGLLKLDCEGSEYSLLEAVPDSLWKRIDRVAMEYHPVAGGGESWTGERLEDRLRALGYEVRRMPSRKYLSKGLLFSERGTRI